MASPPARRRVQFREVAIGQRFFDPISAEYFVKQSETLAAMVTGLGDGTIPDEFEADDVVGIDRLEGCTTIAEGLCRHYGFDNTAFHAADVTYIETFPDESFDTVWMYSALQYVERGYTLSQVHRVLKPGGTLFVGNYNSNGLMLEHV